jgi:hypothetical protein
MMHKIYKNLAHPSYNVDYHKHMIRVVNGG